VDKFQPYENTSNTRVSSAKTYECLTKRPNQVSWSIIAKDRDISYLYNAFFGNYTK